MSSNIDLIIEKKNNYLKKYNNMSLISSLSMLFLINLTRVLPLGKITLINQFKYFMYIHKDIIFPSLVFLSASTFSRMECLVDLICVDQLDLVNRFTIFYSLSSISLCARLNVVTLTKDLDWVPSIVNIYPNSNWAEREAWDLFGTGFLNHPDLRRILTDYGFKGHPMRKEFPVVGFLEVAYNNMLDFIEYKKVSLSFVSRQFFMSNHENIYQYE
jgi:NADH-quinone oxidoreductase subunit C